ncbi:redox protein [Neiella marina]|uniref:Redox protein n=1 Tax=Neiella marina TaxID=508461 RepID=A0A8J2U7A9_9GAMM|nr:DCC1-like thiol-disulfide oxidoreductase family protein [Neiella marina]GGA83564.1 redox protein [Neiella marina]
MIKLTVFYDGTCPLCVKEMNALARYDKKQQIKTVDLYSDEFANYPQIDQQKADRVLHAIDDEQQLLLGLDVTHRAWQLVGKGWMYAPLRWKWIKPLADRCYLYFANNRYEISMWLTGSARCNKDSCSAPPTGRKQ